jgi:hypothetical protein
VGHERTLSVESARAGSDGSATGATPGATMPVEIAAVVQLGFRRTGTATVVLPVLVGLLTAVLTTAGLITGEAGKREGPGRALAPSGPAGVRAGPVAALVLHLVGVQGSWPV